PVIFFFVVRHFYPPSSRPPSSPPSPATTSECRKCFHPLSTPPPSSTRNKSLVMVGGRVSIRFHRGPLLHSGDLPEELPLTVSIRFHRGPLLHPTPSLSKPRQKRFNPPSSRPPSSLSRTRPILD